MLDYHRFGSDTLLDFHRAECEVIRRHSAGVPITTNFMTLDHFRLLDYHDWAPHQDVVSTDHYVVDALEHPRAELSFAGDLTRGIAGGAPWMLMEHSTSAVNWQPVNPAKPPRETVLDSLTHVARGADALGFFQWRQSRAGSEKFHSALVPHAGEDSDRFREVCELGAVAARLGEVVGSRVEAEVALLWDYEAAWAVAGPCMPSAELDYATAAHTVHRLLRDRGVTCDVVHPDADLTGYRVVVVPTLYLVSDAAAAAVAAAAEGGAHVLVTYFSGIVDPDDHVRLGGYPGAFRELLGVRVEEFFPLRVGEQVGLDGGGHGTVWSEDVRLRGAEPVLTLADGPLAGRPAATRRPVGDGVAWYLGTLPDDATLGRLLDRVVGRGRRRADRRGAARRRGRAAALRHRLVAVRPQPHGRRLRGRGRRPRPRRGHRRRAGHRRPRPHPSPWSGRADVLASQRRAAILAIVEEHGAARVSELVEQLAVSDMTVRRDIERLDREGLLERVHGGAVAAQPRATDEPGFTAKSTLMTAEKQAIAQEAARLVQPGATIGISAGTTTYELALAIRSVPQLTVVTNSVPVAQLLHESEAAGHVVVLTGGVRTPSDALVGPVAVTALQGLHVDRLFLGAHGIDRDAGPHHARTSSRPRPTGPSCAPAARCACSPTAASSASSGSRPSWPSRTSTPSSPTPASPRGPGRCSRRRSSSSCSPSRSGRGRAGCAPRTPDEGGARGAPHRRTARRRAPDHLLRRHPRRPGAHGRRHPGPRAPRRRRPHPLRRARRRLGGGGRPPDEPHLPPAARTSAPSAPPAAAACPRRSRTPTTTSWCSRTGSPRTRPWPTTTWRPRRGTSTPRPLGRTEVVCFTSDHESTFAALSPQRVRTVVDVWADRTTELGADPDVAHVFCFENRGQEIGVTLHHPHGQVYGYPYVPARTAEILARATEHHARTGRLLGADLLEAERADGSRVVLTGEHWTAYVPYAARWPRRGAPRPAPRRARPRRPRRRRA